MPDLSLKEKTRRSPFFPAVSLPFHFYDMKLDGLYQVFPNVADNVIRNVLSSRSQHNLYAE